MFEYYSPYASKNSSKTCVSSSCINSASARRDRLVNMLDSLKIFLHGGSRSSKPQTHTEKKPESKHKPTPLNPHLPKPHLISFSGKTRRFNQAHPISMAEYLSLEQLETVWWQQDTLNTYVDRPRQPKPASDDLLFSTSRPAHRCPDVYMHELRTCCHFL